MSEVVADCGNNRKKSIAWDHFEKIKIGKDQYKAICHYCQKIIVLIIMGMVLLIC